MRTLRKKQNKEFGIKVRKIMSGKRINKTKCLKNKRVKKPMINGRKSPNFPSLKLDRLKTKEKQVSLDKIGSKEESSDTVGRITNNPGLKEDLDSRTTKPKLSRSDSRQSSSKKPQREENLEEVSVKVRKEALKEGLREVSKEGQEEELKEEKVREDDIFNCFL